MSAVGGNSSTRSTSNGDINMGPITEGKDWGATTTIEEEEEEEEEVEEEKSGLQRQRRTSAISDTLSALSEETLDQLTEDDDDDENQFDQEPSSSPANNNEDTSQMQRVSSASNLSTILSVGSEMLSGSDTHMESHSDGTGSISNNNSDNQSYSTHDGDDFSINSQDFSVKSESSDARQRKRGDLLTMEEIMIADGGDEDSDRRGGSSSSKNKTKKFRNNSKINAIKETATKLALQAVKMLESQQKQQQQQTNDNSVTSGTMGTVNNSSVHSYVSNDGAADDLPPIITTTTSADTSSNDDELENNNKSRESRPSVSQRNLSDDSLPLTERRSRSNSYTRPVRVRRMGSTNSINSAIVGRNLSAYLPKSLLGEIYTRRMFVGAYGNTLGNSHIRRRTSYNSAGSGGGISDNNTPNSCNAPPEALPRSWPTRRGGVLMIDVSGFTKLTVKLSRDFESDTAISGPSTTNDNDNNISLSSSLSNNNDFVFKRKSLAETTTTTQQNSQGENCQIENAIKSQRQSITKPSTSVNKKSQGLSPAEKMSLILNDYFGKMINCIERLGGDVIKFAGDALLCYFPADINYDYVDGDTDRQQSHPDQEGWTSLKSIILRMTRCSLELLRDCSDYEIPFPIKSSSDNNQQPQQHRHIKLNVHVVCSIMPITCMSVGGLSGRLEFVLSGDEKFQMLGDLLDNAESGQVAFDKVMWEGLQQIILDGGGICGNGNSNNDFDNLDDEFDEDLELIHALQSAKVEEIFDTEYCETSPSIQRRQQKPIIGYKIVDASTILFANEELYVPILSEKSPLQFAPCFSSKSAGADPFIRSYVPHNVLHYHDFNQSSLLCENRTVSVVFCSLPARLCSTYKDTQSVVLKIQTVLKKHHGLLRQFMVDDKTTVAISVWGCPPLAHMDDAARAVKAALDMRSEFGTTGCHIGVATGMCYCGMVGSPSRCEYVVIGEAVNFAARLMVFSMKNGGKDKTTNTDDMEVTVLIDDASAKTLSSSHGVPLEGSTTINLDGYRYAKFETTNSGSRQFKGVGIQRWYEVRQIVDNADRHSRRRRASLGDSSKDESVEEIQDAENLINFNRQKLVGRDVEIKMITGALYRSLSLGADGLPLTDKTSTPPPYILCVHGPMGIGKSSLATELIIEITRLKRINSSKSRIGELSVIELECEEQERNTPWYSIRGLLPLLWETVSSFANSEDASTFLESDSGDDYFEGKQWWLRSVALLTDLSGSDGSDVVVDDVVPEDCLDLLQLSSEFTETLSGETRLSNLLELLMHLLTLAIGEEYEEASSITESWKASRLLLVVDDLQSCDSNSIQFYRKFVDLCEKHPGRAMMHLAIRPGASKEAKDVRDCCKQIIRLQRLNGGAIRNLVLSIFGLLDTNEEETGAIGSSAKDTARAKSAATCDPELGSFVELSSAGLPLFAVEACRYIRQKQLVTFDDTKNVLRLSKAGENTLSSSKKESVSAEEVTQRSVRVLIDALSPEARLLLKCSSLMPQQFKLFDVVLLAKAMSQSTSNDGDGEQKVRIGEDNEKGAKVALEEIVANRLWERSSVDKRLFRFSHKFMSETVYKSMTGEQRKTLHSLYFYMIEATMAEKKDSKTEQNVGSVSPLLQHGTVRRNKKILRSSSGSNSNQRRRSRRSRNLHRSSSRQDYRRRQHTSPHSLSTSSLEWRATNAALAGIHDKAAALYFLSAKEQFKSFSYKAADASMSEVLDHLKEWDESLGSNNIEPCRSIDKSTRVAIMRLRGLLYCLLDRPMEGKPFLEKSLLIADEKTILSEASIMPCVVAEETVLQHVHRMFDLESSPNIEVLDYTEKADIDKNGIIVTKHKLPDDQAAVKEARTTMSKECSAAFDQLARVYLQSGDPLRGIFSCLRGLNLAEMVGPCEELAKAYSTYAFVKKSPFYGSRAREVAVGVGELAPVTGFCAMLYGGMLIGEGNFTSAEGALNQAVKVSAATKDLSTLGLSLSVLGWSLYVSGQFEKSLESSRQMQQIGEEKNDPRFKNWGLTSLFRSTLALRDMNGANEILPEMQKYIDEYEESMYNSDKIGLAGMMISMRLLEEDFDAVRKAMDHWKDVVELVLNPCTQLVEFAGCVGIIEGMIATCEDDAEKNLPRLEKALESFEQFASTYPIFNCRLNYLRGLTELVKGKINGSNSDNEALDFFRLSVSWARRFDLPHEEQLVRNMTDKDLVDKIFAEEIPVKEFSRNDSALDGIVCDEVVRDFRKLLEEVGDDEEEFHVWNKLADNAASRLAAIWGTTNAELLRAVEHVRTQLLKETLVSLSTSDNCSEEFPSDKISNSSKDSLTVLAYCIAAYRSAKAKEAADSSTDTTENNHSSTDTNK